MKELNIFNFCKTLHSIKTSFLTLNVMYAVNFFFETNGSSTPNKYVLLWKFPVFWDGRLACLDHFFYVQWFSIKFHCHSCQFNVALVWPYILDVVLFMNKHALLCSYFNKNLSMYCLCVISYLPSVSHLFPLCISLLCLWRNFLHHSLPLWCVALCVLLADNRLLYLDPHTTQPALQLSEFRCIPDEVSDAYVDWDLTNSALEVMNLPWRFGVHHETISVAILVSKSTHSCLFQSTFLWHENLHWGITVEAIKSQHLGLTEAY